MVWDVGICGRPVTKQNYSILLTGVLLFNHRSVPLFLNRYPGSCTGRDITPPGLKSGPETALRATARRRHGDRRQAVCVRGAMGGS